MFPEYVSDELQQGDDVQRPRLRARGFAVEEEVEEFKADRVALSI